VGYPASCWSNRIDVTAFDAISFHHVVVSKNTAGIKSQLSLDLREIVHWGRRRAGAGRKRGPQIPHAMRPPLAARFPCQVTLKIRRDVPSLRSVRLVREVESSFREACRRKRFRLAHYSIRSDHVHLLVEASSAHELACGMKSIGARFARAVNRVFERRGPVLADRFHVRVLRSPREVRNALAYVLLNARQHLAKLGGRRRSLLRVRMYRKEGPCE